MPEVASSSMKYSLLLSSFWMVANQLAFYKSPVSLLAIGFVAFTSIGFICCNTERSDTDVFCLLEVSLFGENQKNVPNKRLIAKAKVESFSHKVAE